MAAKKRCQFVNDTEETCHQAALRLVGTCPFCKDAFCGDHRLPERHCCTKMEDCRQEAFAKNKAKLESERTVASKIAAA